MKATNNALPNTEELRNIVIETIMDAPDGDPAKLLLRVDSRVSAPFASALRKTKAEMEEETRKSQQFAKRAQELEEQLEDIPRLAARESLSLPPSALARCGFFILLLFAAILTVGDGLNLAAFLRFITDSLPLAILLSLVVFACPIAEAALLNREYITERTRHRVISLQGVLAVFLVAAYLHFSLRFGSPAPVPLFSSNQTTTLSGSDDYLRMLFQVLASINLISICLSIALSMVRERSQEKPNPAYLECVAENKEQSDKAGRHAVRAAEFAGEIEEIEEQKKQSLLHAETILDEVVKSKSTIEIAQERIFARMRKSTAAVAAGFLFVGLSACSPPPLKPGSTVATSTNELVLAVSPFLKQRADVLDEVVRWLTRQPNAHVSVFDAWEGTRIAEFTVPAMTYYREDVVLAKIGAPIGQLRRWVESSPNQNTLAGSGALDLPRLISRVAQSVGGHSQQMILIGSPIARFPNEPTYDFGTPELRVAAVGHFKHEASPFFVKTWNQSLTNLTTQVSFVFPHEDTSAWPTSYEKALRNFWTCFLAANGARLATFSPDLSSGLRAGASIEHPQQDLVEFLASTPSLEMVNAHRKAAAPSPEPVPPLPSPSVLPSITPIVSVPPTSNVLQILRSEAPRLARIETNAVVPPSVSNAAVVKILPPPLPGVTIVLRYRNDAADADLYLQPHDTAAEISFRRNETPLGSYRYQFDFALGEHVKWINLPGGVDPQKAKMWINYASGIGRLSGKILWQSPEGTRQAPFSFACVKGGDSTLPRQFSRKRSDHWQRIHLLDLTTYESSTQLSSDGTLNPR